MISWLVKSRIRIRGEVIIPMTQRVLHHVSSFSPQDHHSILLWGDFSWLRVTAKSVKIETSGISRSSSATAIRTKMRMYAASTKESTYCPRAVPELKKTLNPRMWDPILCRPFFGTTFWTGCCSWPVFMVRFAMKYPMVKTQHFRRIKWLKNVEDFLSLLSVFNPNMSPPSNNYPFPSVHTYENTLLFLKSQITPWLNRDHRILVLHNGSLMCREGFPYSWNQAPKV